MFCALRFRSSMAVAVLLLSGCSSNRAVYYDTPNLRMEHSGLATLTGTPRKKLVQKFGSPTGTTVDAQGREVLHYYLPPTVHEYVIMPIFGHEKQSQIHENLYVFLSDGHVVGGRWERPYGTSKWGNP